MKSITTIAVITFFTWTHENGHHLLLVKQRGKQRRQWQLATIAFFSATPLEKKTMRTMCFHILLKDFSQASL